jgi:succinoglycan biosynthesis transport protein ExoP
MYMTPTNNPEPHNPTSTQYPLRPASKASAFRINVKRSLRLHPVTAILVTLVTLGMGLAVVARHKATYAAAASIYVSPTFPKTLTEDHEQDRPYDSYIQQQIHAITRYDIMAQAIHKMPPGLWQAPDESEQSAVERLQRSLEITRVGNTYQVEIAIIGGRPEHLADIVNTVTNTYLDKAKSEEYYGRDERIATLKEERTRIQTEIDSRLQDQTAITKVLGVASVNPEGTNALDDDNAKLQADLTAAHEKRIDAEAQLAALKAGDSSAPNSALNAAADEIIATDPQLVGLKTALSQKRGALLEQLSSMTPSHPARKKTEDDLAQIDKALQNMQSELRSKAAARLEQKYRTQLNQAQMIESRLLSDLQHGTKAAAEAAPRFQKAAELKADLERLEARYTAVDDRLSNLELESSSPGSVHLFSPAMTPLGPEKSKITKLLIGIFPVSIILGILTAVVLDLLDPHIYTASDVEAVLGFAPIGMLFDDREVTQLVFDECALRLAAGIEHASRLAGARTFVITGVNSGAGTSSIVDNLGSMLAKLGRKTLVIDPSGASEPVAYVTFGSHLQKQPVDFSERNASPSSSRMERQAALPAGASLPTRVSPMSSPVLQSFQAMTAEYDIVLIDAAPVLLSAETEYLARMADVTVLVAEAGKTKKAWLTRAARLLERLGIAGAAAVVNKVNPARIEEALKDDLREFELRSDRVNLEEWWKPKKKAAATASAETFEKEQGHADEEDEVFARDI